MSVEAAKKAAEKAAEQAPRDDGEDIYLMEPMRISEENGARPELTELVLEILFRGSLPKSEVADAMGQSVRSARAATNALSKLGIIASNGARADWQIAFPAKLAPRIAPGLFPD